MAKIIFGGGFDPVHLGHINMALLAKESLNAEVIFVPAKVAIWKNESIDPKHKLNMLNLAIKDYPGFSIDTFEIDSKEQPYSIDTLHYFKKKYPKESLYLLIGQDQVNSFHLWKKAEEIAEIAQIVYFKRPKYSLNIQNVEKYHMLELEGNEIDVASSDIRELKSAKMPLSVLTYIEENELYYISKIKSYIKESRYNHSVSVAHLAYSLAKKHGLDYSKAYIAGILHDIAKYYDKNEALALMKQYYPDYVDIGAFAYHQFLGVKIAKEDFGVVDEEILGAIMFHTTGKSNMNWLEKLIYSADKIDPTRGYDSSDLIAAMENGVEEGFITVLQANYDFLIKKHVESNNRLSEECFKQYILK